MTRSDIDLAVAAIARRQHGAFTRAQACGAGATRRMSDRRVQQRLWLVLDHGVMALPGNPFTWHRQCMAAVLGERRAVVSGRAAAVLHGFSRFRPGRVEITVPRASNHRSRLALVHQSDLVEATRVHNIGVVSPAQAFIEMARHLNVARLGALLDELHGSDRRALDAVRERFVDLARSRWPGIGRVRAVLDERGDGYVPSESELEGQLWSLLGRLSGCVLMVRQARLPWWDGGRGRADDLIPAWAAIIEADGRRWHTRVRDFEVDRERDNLAVVNGYRALRFTWREITERPRDVLAVIERLRVLDATTAAPAA